MIYIREKRRWMHDRRERQRQKTKRYFINSAAMNAAIAQEAMGCSLYVLGWNLSEKRGRSNGWFGKEGKKRRKKETKEKRKDRKSKRK
jgi:hypothetical protein